MYELMRFSSVGGGGVYEGRRSLLKHGDHEKYFRLLDELLIIFANHEEVGSHQSLGSPRRYTEATRSPERCCDERRTWRVLGEILRWD